MGAAAVAAWLTGPSLGATHPPKRWRLTVTNEEAVVRVVLKDALKTTLSQDLSHGTPLHELWRLKNTVPFIRPSRK